MTEEWPVSIRANANVATAAKFMLFWDVDALRVVGDDDRFLGVVSEHDLVRFLATDQNLLGTKIEELIDKLAPSTDLSRGARISRAPARIKDQLAGEIMSSPGIACREETRFEEIAELLADREISGMPVVNADGEVTGVISERDLAHALGSPLIRLAIRHPVHSGPFLRGPRGVAEGAQRAKDIMTTPAIIAHADTPLHVLAKIMVTNQINRIPIVRDKRLVGVVTRGDVLAAIAGLGRREVELEEPPVVMGSGVPASRFAAEPTQVGR